MTQPDSPKSPTQKYRLTEKGRILVNSIWLIESKKFALSQLFPYLCIALLQQNTLLNNKLCINEIEISINDIL